MLTKRKAIFALAVKPFGKIDDVDIPVLELRSAAGLCVRVLTLGAIVQSIDIPDASGTPVNVVLGYSELDGYRRSGPYFGAVVGRYANRIAGGRFVLNGKVFQLPLNNGPNHLHGGPAGFSHRVWSLDRERSIDHRTVSLTLVSEDGDQGYPGRLQSRVTYALLGEHGLTFEYEATTDLTTIVNLSQHTYFNLAGEGSGSALGHLLRLNAGAYTPVDDHLIPTGEVASVTGTPFDFRTPKPIEQDLRSNQSQMLMARGFDHNLVIDRPADGPDDLVEVAHLLDPRSGRSLTVHSTEPGVQFYSGNFLDGSEAGTSGRTYRQGDGIALETQHFPDSPNHPEFPSTTLDPGDRYHSRTTWHFAWER